MYYAEEGFQPEKFDSALVGITEYWLHIADQAYDFFTDKEWFMNWVTSHYFGDEHRFAASACWDIIRLGEDE